METEDARIHTGRDDRDGGAGCRCWEAWAAALCWATSSEEGELTGWGEAKAAFAIWHAEAAPWHQSVDGLHSRDARQKA